MATSVKLLLDQRRAKADGTYPIVLRLIHNRDSRNISLEYCASIKDWSEKDKEVKNSYPNSNRVNVILQKKLTNAKRVLVDHESKLASLSVDEIKTLIINFNPEEQENIKGINFFTFSKEIIDRLKQSNRLGSATAYECCVSSIKKFQADKESLLISQINYKFLLNWEAYCLGHDLKINSIGNYMRSLRAILNLAIKDGHLKQEDYPFKHYRIKKEDTMKRAIPTDQIKTFIEADLKPHSNRWNSRNYFALIFYMRGMNFMDIAFLKMSNIQGDRLKYNRIKTKKQYNIKITAPARAIFDLYISYQKPDSDELVFPIIPSDQLEDFPRAYKTYLNRRKYFNKDLKAIAKQCGITINLTSYVGRHSWASAAKFSGVNTTKIGEALGHSDAKTTEAYLAHFEQEELDNVNNLVLQKMENSKVNQEDLQLKQA